MHIAHLSQQQIEFLVEIFYEVLKPYGGRVIQTAAGDYEGRTER